MTIPGVASDDNISVSVWIQIDIEFPDYNPFHPNLAYMKATYASGTPAYDYSPSDRATDGSPHGQYSTTQSCSMYRDTTSRKHIWWVDLGEVISVSYVKVSSSSSGEFSHWGRHEIPAILQAI